MSREKIRITIDLDLTPKGVKNMRTRNDRPLWRMANDLRDALQRDHEHIQGVRVNIEERSI